MGSALAPLFTNILPLQGPWPLTAGRILESLGGGLPVSGARVTQDSALGISAYYAAIRVISESLASLPLFPFERLAPKGRRQATDHPLYRILSKSPNPWMTSFQFRETMGGHLCVRGNFFANIEHSANGQPKNLWPLRPDRMGHPVVSEAGTLLYPYTTPDGETQHLAQRDVLHIRGLSDDGIMGYSPLTLHRETLGHAIATQEYGSRFFGQGARPGGVLETPNKLNPETATRMAQSWVDGHQGLSNAHRIAVLEEGVHWQSIGMSNDDAEYLESRKFSVAEIARIYRVPPHMIGDVDRSTSWGTGIEQMTIGFVTFTLLPWLERIEQQLDKDLLLTNEQSRYYIKHIVAGLLRGDIATRQAFYSAMIDRGVYNPDDIREMEDQNPLPDGLGEDYRVALNTQIVGQEAPMTAPELPQVPA